MKRPEIIFSIALVIATAAGSAPATVSAAMPLERIQSMLARPEVVCGRFEQSKQLAGLKKPLASSGQFCISPSKGVLWKTLHPFPNTLRLTRDEIVQTQGQRVSMRLDARQEPAVRVINNMLFSLMAGDLRQLTTLFDGEGAANERNWSAALKARDPGLARVITAVAVEGDKFVRNIVIYETNGDRTSIAFSALESGTASLPAEEAAQF